MRTISAIICIGALAACSAVNLESGAQSVRVVTNDLKAVNILAKSRAVRGISSRALSRAMRISRQARGTT